MDAHGKSKLLAGIFVGGSSSRMGGRAKGLLRAPSGESLLERWGQLFDRVQVRCVLVGRRAEYGAIEREVLDDEPRDIGPLGGLAALLRAADGGRAIAVACDMPFVSEALVRRLIEHPSAAAALAPRPGGRWEPMFARYDAAQALAVVARRAGSADHALQHVLTELDAEALPLSDEEQRLLHDWDAPCDMDAP